MIDLKEKIKRINKEMSVKNIEELRMKLEDYKSIKSNIDKIEDEIKWSKNLFKNLPKDRS